MRRAFLDLDGLNIVFNLQEQAVLVTLVALRQLGKTCFSGGAFSFSSLNGDCWHLCLADLYLQSRCIQKEYGYRGSRH